MGTFCLSFYFLISMQGIWGIVEAIARISL
jgi:hypothetical protein